MMARTHHKPALGRPALLRDERGSMLAFFAVSCGVMFSLTALVWDIGRVLSTATDLQSFADHMALAAAGELDGATNARQRAQNIADTLLQDRQSFADGDLGLSGADVTLRFLRDLPDDDNDPIDAGFDATSDADAAFVEVTVNPHTVTHVFIGAMEALTGTDVVDTTVLSPRAIAGFTQYVCDITPLMFCAPSPNYSPIPGRQIHLKSGDGWGPGAFGLLDLNFDPDGPCGNPNQGANYFRCALGVTDSITRCFARSGVDIRPGQMTGAAAAGFNTRFDMYLNSLQGERNNPDFAPAPNVVKGYGRNGGGACINNMGNLEDFSELPPGEASVRLPRDDCFGTGDLCNGTSRFGTGVSQTALDDYWTTNHDSARPAANTRYQLYLEELAAPPAADRMLEAPRKETGAPICSSSTPADGETRRLLIAAAVDCNDPAVPIQGNASDVPVLKFVEIFLTEPAGIEGGGSNTSVWVEEVREVAAIGGGEAAGVIHNFVQLYR